MKGMGLDEESINNKYNIDDTILDEQKNKLAKFYSDFETEMDKQNKNSIEKYKDASKKKEEIVKESMENL